MHLVRCGGGCGLVLVKVRIMVCVIGCDVFDEKRDGRMGAAMNALLDRYSFSLPDDVIAFLVDIKVL